MVVHSSMSQWGKAVSDDMTLLLACGEVYLLVLFLSPPVRGKCTSSL
jgi:hypothetical protein